MKNIFSSFGGSLLRGLDGFFFARRSAWPFGLMRIAWAWTVFAFLLMQWNEVANYYSDIGFLPRDLTHLVTRNEWIFSVLFWNGEPWYAFAVYLLLLASLVCTMLGVAPRISMILSYVLLASFHERDAMTLGGGDTVLRNVGFILMLAPGIEALSFKRLRLQYAHWRTSRTLFPPVTMSAWPYRLLLWQMIVLYGTSLWWKLLGNMWLDGTAVGAALHHMTFLRFSYAVTNEVMPFAAFITYATLWWEGTWLLLLVPHAVTNLLPRRLRIIPLKRLILAGGIFFHGGIALFMDVGSFSYAMFVAYLGLLDNRDRTWLTRLAARHQAHPIVVLYDGSCRLCRRSAFGLMLLDAFKHLKLVDFRDDQARKEVAPHLSESQLDLAMHILLPERSPGEALAKSGQSVRTGYVAFRHMSWHLPALWPFAPFLYLPGVSHLGRRIYAWIAANRLKCSHDRC